MGFSIDQLLTLLWRELYRYRRAVFVAFAVISVAVLLTAMLLPKVYRSYTVIHADESNIIRPLMEGTAVATGVKDQAQNARELLFSRRIMLQVLREAGMQVDDLSELKLERLIDDVQKRTRILGSGQSLIRIEYRDPSPQMAFRVTQKYAELFVTESASAKRQESQEAYAFIDKQVRDYHKKLIEAESRLKEYRSENIEGTATDSFKRISELRRRLEGSRLELSETRIRADSLEQQLSGEADVTRGMAREGAYRSRIAELQMELDTLRLSFHDTYPDIVQLKSQIEELNHAIEQERVQREQRIREARARGEAYIDESIANSPLYQQLRSELSQARTEIATLEARITETEGMLAEENERIKRIHDAEAALAELTRDYEVNRDLYQDLLRRREKARVSMHLDIEERGLTMKVQEPARLSLKPYGLRFLHLALLGLPLALLLPVAAVLGLLQVDPRVRISEQIADQLGLPVAGEIHEIQTPRERQDEGQQWRKMAMVTAAIVGCYLFAAVLKWLQVI
jgi:polysaccharide chain length determinant protein (PEP-CTERM system associated)